MTIEEVIATRGITEVLHFTTHDGLLGILASGSIKSRERLSKDEQLEFILRLNTPIVKDRGWEDYVNFSLSKINLSLYQISSSHWHSEAWWRILAFDPIILTHPGVMFATTNNIWPAVRRQAGDAGLEGMFADPVYGYYGAKLGRGPAHHPSVTTCPQAEVLYPGEVSSRFLRKIYVPTGEDKDDVSGQMAGVDFTPVPVIISPNKFRGELSNNE